MPGSQNNLLDFETETLNSTVGGWIVDLNVTVARSTAQAVEGPASLSMTSVAAGVFSAKCINIGAKDRTTYTFSAWFRSATAGLVCSFFVDWFGPTGILLNTTIGNTVTLVANTWTKVTTVVTPPAGTDHATMYAGNATAAGAGVVLFMDSIFLGSPGETDRLTVPPVGPFPPRDFLRPGARQWQMPTPVKPTIFRVTGTSANSAAAVPYTATLATGCLAGDVLVVAGASQGTHAANGMAVQDSVNSVPFTTVLETQGGSASSRWLQTFVYKTTVDLPPGTTLSFTPYAASTQNGFVVDVFRGVSATIAQAAVGSSNALAPTSVAPALGAAPPVGSLVLTFCQAGSGTLTSGFTAGSTNTNNNSVGTGWWGATGADGSSTYTSTWVLGTSNTSSAQTVALAVASGGPAATGASAAVTRTATAATGKKGVLATALTVTHGIDVASPNLKGAVAPARADQHSSAQTASLKGAVALARADQHTTTQATKPSPNGVGAATQRATTATVGVKGAPAAAAAVQHVTTVTAVRKQGLAVGAAPTRAVTADVVIKQATTGVGAATVHSTTGSTVIKKAANAGLASTRPVDATAVLKGSLAAGAAIQRAITQGQGALFAGPNGASAASVRATTSCVCVRRSTGAGLAQTRPQSGTTSKAGRSAPSIVVQHSVTGTVVVRQAAASAIAATHVLTNAGFAAAFISAYVDVGGGMTWTGVGDGSATSSSAGNGATSGAQPDQSAAVGSGLDGASTAGGLVG